MHKIIYFANIFCNFFVHFKPGVSNSKRLGVRMRLKKVSRAALKKAKKMNFDLKINVSESIDIEHKYS